MPITLNQHRASITQSVIALFSDDQTPMEGGAYFFPPETTADKQVSIEVERNRLTVAVDVTRYDANRNTFSKSTEKIFVPPYFNEFFDFTATERYDVTFATIQSGGNPNVYDLQKLIKSGYGYAIKLKNKIARAKELMRWGVLVTGVATLVNGDSINFNRQAGSMVQLTGTAVWSALDTATPLADFDAGALFLRQEGLSISPTIKVIMGRTALSNFINNTSVQNSAKFFNQIVRTNIEMPILDKVTGFVRQGQVSGTNHIYEIYTYVGQYENPDGTKSDYLDPNTVVMLPDDFVGVTAHAGVPSIMGDAVNGQIIAPMEGEYYTRDIIDQVRLTWDFYVSSAPVPIPVSVDRIYTIVTVDES
jgi:hypothetical protein